MKVGRRAAWGVVLAMLAAAPSVLAHGGHDHVMGTVKTVDIQAGKLEVETRDGKRIAVALNDKTRYLRGEAKATAADLTVGLRVVIDAGKEADQLVAKEVRLAPAKPVTPK